MRALPRLSHDYVDSLLKKYLFSNLVADEKSATDYELTCIVNDVKLHIVSPVKRKNTSTLERMIADNSSKGEATAFVFPKSSDEYKGNYLRSGGNYLISAGGSERWHNTVKMSAAEIYLADKLSTELAYYDPINPSIQIMELRKLTNHAASKITGIYPPFGAVEGDESLWADGRALKNDVGIGYTLKITDPLKKRRYLQLSKLNHAKIEIREKFLKSAIKGFFTFEIEEYKGLLIAKAIPSTAYNMESAQLKML